MSGSSTTATVSTTAAATTRTNPSSTTDVEFNHHLNVRGRHDLVWGGGFRQVRDTVQPAFDSWFTPVSCTARTYNGFVQDEIALLHDSVRLTAGSKFEWNSFSGVEVQPTARVLWAPTQTHSVWTAVSRAVRVPSRSERDQYELESIAENEDGERGIRTARGLAGIQAREADVVRGGLPLRAREAVFARRGVVLQRVRRSADDRDARGLLTATPIAGVMTPLVRANNAYGRVAGAEVTAFWTVNDVLQLSGNYTRLHMQLHAKPESNDEDAEAFEGKNARNLFYVRAYADLPHQVDLTAELRYVGAIPGEGVPGYAEGNLHVSRALRDRACG